MPGIARHLTASAAATATTVLETAMKTLFSMTVRRDLGEWCADFDAPHGITEEATVFAAAFALTSSRDIETRPDEYQWLVERLAELRDELRDRLCHGVSEDEV
jgi:hypothetical protein